MILHLAQILVFVTSREHVPIYLVLTKIVTRSFSTPIMCTVMLSEPSFQLTFRDS